MPKHDMSDFGSKSTSRCSENTLRPLELTLFVVSCPDYYTNRANFQIGNYRWVLISRRVADRISKLLGRVTVPFRVSGIIFASLNSEFRVNVDVRVVDFAAPRYLSGAPICHRITHRR